MGTRLSSHDCLNLELRHHQKFAVNNIDVCADVLNPLQRYVFSFKLQIIVMFFCKKRTFCYLCTMFGPPVRCTSVQTTHKIRLKRDTHSSFQVAALPLVEAEAAHVQLDARLRCRLFRGTDARACGRDDADAGRVLAVR